MAQTSFRVDDQVADQVEDRLVPGQSKSIWYRYAAETMIQVDPQLDALFDRYDFEERKEFVARAVANEIERVQEQNR